MNTYSWRDEELRRHYATSSAWHAKQRNPPLPIRECTEPKLVLPHDAFALAALHQRLVNSYRYADAELALDKLRELATRPLPPEVNTHQFAVKKQGTSIPLVW